MLLLVNLTLKSLSYLVLKVTKTETFVSILSLQP
jgi:hypothetical protein